MFLFGFLRTIVAIPGLTLSTREMSYRSQIFYVAAFALYTMWDSLYYGFREVDTRRVD